MTPETRRAHHAWLTHLTGLATAAGREERAERWIERWVESRPGLELRRDPCGNLVVRRRDAGRGEGGPVLYFTAHLDHPAFVVERVLSPGAVEMSFRGGVMEEYFEGAAFALHGRDASIARGRIVEPLPAPTSPFKHWLGELESSTPGAARGDVATWDLPEPEIRGGMLHALACDDLAGLAAAIGAYDVLALEPPAADVRLLFTRAEEIGFVGAIGACRHGTIEPGARVLALETSRALPEAPIGEGPIVRVGDRMSTFSPALTACVARRAEEIGSSGAPWAWQRKLMAGGACEATVFCAAGFEATCVCVALGNYHNMGNLEAVQAARAARAKGGAGAAPEARIEREFISTADFDGLVDLLVACGRSLPDGPSVAARLDRLWTERAFVLEA